MNSHLTTNTVNTIESAIESACAIILASLPRGTSDWSKEALKANKGGRFRDHLSLEINRGWGVSCTLYVNPELAKLTSVYDPDAETTYKLAAYKVKTEISWSCTNRSVSMAVAAVALYEEVIKLAAEIDSVLNDGLYFSKTDLSFAQKEGRTLGSKPKAKAKTGRTKRAAK